MNQNDSKEELTFPEIDTSFERSYEIVKDDPEALNELNKIQKTLIEAYKSNLVKYNAAKERGESAEVLSDILAEVLEAENEARVSEIMLLDKLLQKKQKMSQELEELNRKMREKTDELLAEKKNLIKHLSSARKIYPNDPCPCGSGKKFKKCCGRNN
jgi:hypothetical protein